MKKQTNAEIVESIKEKFGIDTTIEGDKLIGNCNVHGNFTRMLAGSRYNRYLCDSCAVDARCNSNRENAKTQRLDLEKLSGEFKILHNNLYEYCATDEKNKIGIYCKIHGLFSLYICSHKKGAGCPACKKQKITDKKVYSANIRKLIGKSNVVYANKQKTISKKVILELFRNSHGDKFDYIWVDFTGKSGTVVVVCSEHGNTTQIIDEHIKSVYGCRHCANYSVSSAELDWLASMGVQNKQKVIRHDLGHFKVDGFVEETNTVYEYFGDYWHGHPRLWGDYPFGINNRNKKMFIELFDETDKRLTIIRSLGYNIKYIWESEMIVRDYKGKLEYELY